MWFDCFLCASYPTSTRWLGGTHEVQRVWLKRYVFFRADTAAALNELQHAGCHPVLAVDYTSYALHLAYIPRYVKGTWGSRPLRALPQQSYA